MSKNIFKKKKIYADTGTFYIHIYCIISLYMFRPRPLEPSFTLVYIATEYTLYRLLICTSSLLATEVSHCGICLFIWHCHYYALVDAAKSFRLMFQTRNVPVVSPRSLLAGGLLTRSCHLIFFRLHITRSISLLLVLSMLLVRGAGRYRLAYNTSR